MAALVLAGCSLPRDPEGTLQRATGGTIRAGVTAREPWARLEGEAPAGVEVDLVEGFAREIDAEVRWLPGAEAELMAALETGQLDVIVGGLESTNPWAGSVTLTHPYLTTALVVGAPVGHAALTDLAGVEVAVESGTQAAGLLSKTDAVVVPLEDLADARGRPAAVEQWLLDDLGLVDTGVRLAEARPCRGRAQR